jgi:hypothetical protein
MRKLIFISLLALFASCSQDDFQEDIEETIIQQRFIAVEDYSQELIGTWLDTGDDPEDIHFDGSQATFSKGETSIGPYDYYVQSNNLTIDYNGGIVITKEIKVTADSLYFAGKTFLRQ